MGPLSRGAPGPAAWLSATMAAVSVSVCPGAGSTTENVCAQGVAAQTTDAGSLLTWVQFSDVRQSYPGCYRLHFAPTSPKTRYVPSRKVGRGVEPPRPRAAPVPSAATMRRAEGACVGQHPIHKTQSAPRRDRPGRVVAEECRLLLAVARLRVGTYLSPNRSAIEFPRPEQTHPIPSVSWRRKRVAAFTPDVSPPERGGRFRARQLCLASEACWF